MAQDIIDRIAMLEEPGQDLSPIQWRGTCAMRSAGFELKDAPIGPGHDLGVKPIAQPSTFIDCCFYVGGQCGPGEDTAYIRIIDDIQVFEYFCNAPFIRLGPGVQLFIRQAQERLRAGFNKLDPVQ